MSRAPIATLRNVQLSLGGTPLFSGVDLSLSKGQRTSLVGRNGAGKSTLMRILAQELDADDGDIWRQPGTTLHYLKQEPDFSGFTTALDIVAADVPAGERHRAEAELEMTGLAPDLDPKTLSGGQRRRLALARAFAADPDILLLDEPTNHLDIAAIEALEARLKSFRGAMLVVSHDRRFLETVTTAIAWLRQGVVRAFDQGYKHFEPLAEQVEADEEKALDRLETKLKAEHRWLARGVTARRKRNQGRLRKLQGMRAERMSRRSAMNEGKTTASLVSETSEGASKLVVEAKGVSKAFDTDDGPLSIVNELNLKIMRGDRVGV
ncbi:MAG: ATP-binding cassette domain-containing protein, partial [Pseudomonadota bacterium]